MFSHKEHLEMPLASIDKRLCNMTRFLFTKMANEKLVVCTVEKLETPCTPQKKMRCTIYIVACQGGGVSNKLLGQRQDTGPGILWKSALFCGGEPLTENQMALLGEPFWLSFFSQCRALQPDEHVCISISQWFTCQTAHSHKRKLSWCRESRST